MCSTLTKAGSDKAMEALSLHAMEVMSKNLEVGPAMMNELVRKVLKYEQEPPQASGFYENITFAAFFQDYNADNYADAGADDTQVSDYAIA